MHQYGSTHDSSAENLPDRLMAQANTKYWSELMKMANRRFCYTGLLRYAWTRRNHDLRRLQSLDFIERDFVIAEHAELRTQLPEILHEVVRKRIVVIDNDNHSNPFCARVIARISALDLLTVSMYSVSGTESATMPPPA